ncbi:Hepatocellular carcinoma-associated antigen 59 [Ceratocystis lukuohia]|uniref:Hepatocellular carcinoma-associated antigen 59 n=1 Tax=Ceratocystis lukuohia TaxID=2019550 RepID=A0ABR4MP34_9PEZI
MSDALQPTAEEQAPIIFKSKKNRKQIRTRPSTVDTTINIESSTNVVTDAHASSVTANEAASNPKMVAAGLAAPGDDSLEGHLSDDETIPALSGVLRKAKKSRLQGVAFRVEASRPTDDDGEEDGMALVVRDKDGEGEEGVIVGGHQELCAANGDSGESGKPSHSRLAKRHQSSTDSNQENSVDAANGALNSSFPFAAPLVSAPTLVAKVPEGQKPTQSGKLMEVDLGDEARMKNIDSIERAKRRFIGEGDAHGMGDTDSAQRNKRIRDRKASDEIKRDQVVEAFLHENKLDVYDISQVHGATSNFGDENLNDLPADDRVAEKFRRDFMDAMSQRIRRRRAARAPAINNQAPRPGAKRDDEMLKGPKLGGSRNTRAQMRDILLQKEKDKGKGNGNIRTRK